MIDAVQRSLNRPRASRRISTRDIADNVARFQMFGHGGKSQLSRACFFGPREAQINVTTTFIAKKMGAVEWRVLPLFLSFGDANGEGWEFA